MRKILIWLLAVVFVASLTVYGIGCKVEEAVEEAAEEDVEEVAEAETSEVQKESDDAAAALLAQEAGGGMDSNTKEEGEALRDSLSI